MSSVATMYGHRRDQGNGFFANNEKDSSFEIYSPPYLFRGPRPEIASAPSGVAWGSQFKINMVGSDDIGSIALIRLGSPQHGLDTDERSVELQFSQDGNTLTATAPPNGAVAPPGYYYLFVNKKSSKGLIPSVAAIVRVGDLITTQGLGARPALIPMHDSSVPANAGSATPDENSSFNDFGECTGCAKGQRGGLRHDLQQSVPALKQVPIGADDNGPVQQAQQKAASTPPPAIPSSYFRTPRPMLVG
jgi:hypothetical protein